MSEEQEREFSSLHITKRAHMRMLKEAMIQSLTSFDRMAQATITELAIYIRLGGDISVPELYIDTIID
ncbi:MAG: hypothetical protein ACRDL7_11290, partial [Gaiellaceae bacterium]